jgi:hypothetical protein
MLHFRPFSVAHLPNTTKGNRPRVADWALRHPTTAVVMVLALSGLAPRVARAWSAGDCTYADWLPLTELDWTAQANEDLGIRNAVRIFDGTRIDERPGVEGGFVDYSYYHRVRVLDADGIEAYRTLEILVPFPGRIKDLAARVAKPDGRFVDVPKNEIREKNRVSYAGETTRAIVLAFPSIESGDILEWRYTEERRWGTIPRVQFRQQHYVVRAELTWWYPRTRVLTPGGDAWRLQYDTHYLLANRPPTGVETKELPEEGAADRLQVTMLNVAALPHEPYRPADSEVTTYFVGWYSYPLADRDPPYWTRVARTWGRQTDEFIDDGKRLDRWMRGIVAPPRDLAKDLEACLALLHQTVRNRAGVPESELPKDQRNNRNIADVLDSGVGSAYDLAALYTGMLRRLGHDATVFWAVSRTDGRFIAKWENAGQLTVVGTAAAGPGGEIRWIFPAEEGGTTRTLPWFAQDQAAILEIREDTTHAARFPLSKTIPLATADDNQVDLVATLCVDPAGDLLGRLRATWRCESDPGLRRAVLRQEGKGAADFLRDHLGGIGSAVRTWDESARLDGTGVVYACSLRASGQVQAAGNRTLVTLDALRSDDYSLPVQPRELQVHFRYPEITRSRVILTPPEGYTLEAQTVDSVSTEVLRFRSASVDSAGKIVRARELDLPYSMFIPQGADTLRRLFQAVRDIDTKPLVLAPVRGGR